VRGHGYVLRGSPPCGDGPCDSESSS
jgi:hypothetical protein